MASVSDDLGERLVGIEAGFAGQSEHPLSDAVALHLVGPRGDGGHAPIEIVDRGLGVVFAAGRPKQGVATADLDRQARPDGRQGARSQFPVRRYRRVRCLGGAEPGGYPPAEVELDIVVYVSSGQALTGDGIVEPAAAAGQGDQVGGQGPRFERRRAAFPAPRS